MLAQNARKTTAKERQSRRSLSGFRTDDRLLGLRSESPRRRPSRSRSPRLIDDDESVLGVDLSLVEAMRSIVAAGVATIHCTGSAPSGGGEGREGPESARSGRRGGRST